MAGPLNRAPLRESIADMWLFIIITTTILALLLNIMSLSYGGADVAAHVLYIPIVIAAYWYPHRGMMYAFAVSAVYFAIIVVITAAAPLEMVAALIKCVVFAGVAAVVSSLSLHMQKSEMKYRGIFNHSEDGTALVSRHDLTIAEANQHFGKVLGYSASEMPHVNFNDLWVEAGDRERFFAQLDRLKSVSAMETRFCSRDGDARWVLLSAGLLPDDQFVCAMVDITDRKAAEESLVIKDYAIRSSISAVAMFDLEYRITFVNHSLLKVMGSVDEGDFTSRIWEDFVEDKQAFTALRSALADKGSWLGEIILMRGDRTSFFAMLWANIVRDEKGKPVCIMVSFIDITPRKQMELAQRRALEQIEKNIEQFAILGDHIRNPLTVIVGLASIAAEEISEKILVQAKEIDRIVAQLDRGWIESEKVRDFIKRYYKVGAREIEPKEPGAPAVDKAPPGSKICQ